MSAHFPKSEVSTLAKRVVEQVLDLKTVEDLDFVIANAMKVQQIRLSAAVSAAESLNQAELHQQCRRDLDERGGELSDADCVILCCFLLNSEGLVAFQSRDITRKLPDTHPKISNITKTMERLRERGLLVTTREGGSGHKRHSLTSNGLSYSARLMSR